jgi:hypothetical protein
VVTSSLDVSIYLTGTGIYQGRDPHATQAPEAPSAKLIQPQTGI